MTPQSAFMIAAEILPERMAALEECLDSMNIAPGVVDVDNTLLPFSRFNTLHFARFLIINARNVADIEAYDVAPDHWPPTLVFVGDCDGPADDFLSAMAEKAGSGLHDIFSHCRGFASSTGSLLEWMRAHQIQPAANYVNWIGRTVTQVLEEAELHRRLIDRLYDLGKNFRSLPARDLHQALKEHIADEIQRDALVLSDPQPTPLSWWIRNQAHRFGIPLMLLICSPLLLVVLPLFAIRLRVLEKTDPEITPRPDAAHVTNLAVAEDRFVTNQFSAFGDVKPGLFRGTLIKFFLFMLNYAARHVYNKGNLTRVRTIHFARWVLLDSGRRVLFMSNYDGDLESYMDDFINKVGWGLNLVFSNGVGWPRTRWLIKGGSEHEQRFKNYLRRHQYPTAVWYKAYPDLTAVEIERNSQIREGLFKPHFQSDQALQRWFDLI